MHAVAGVFADPVVDVLVCAINQLVYATVGLVLIRMNFGATLDIGGDVALEHATERMRHRNRASATTTLDENGDGRLAVILGRLTVRALSRFAADIDLIRLNDGAGTA